jgi:hypothetical protein
VDDHMKKLLRALSEAVNESLNNSSAFVNAIAAMWRVAQDTPLCMDARLAGSDESPAVNADTSEPPAALALTAADEYFLRALKIATPV